VTFAAAPRLWLLLLVALLVVGYLLVQLRRRRDTVRFTNLELLASVAPRRPGWRRHVPAAALVVALALLVVGFARPMALRRVPKQQATIVIVVDTSLSMRSEDVSPSRLSAAQQAAASFVEDIPDALRLGLISFSGTPKVLVPPSTDHELVQGRIDELELSPYTAIGEAIFTALQVTGVTGEEPPGSDPPGGGSGEPGDGQPGQPPQPDSSDSPDGGDEQPTAHVVLLSDGSTTVGRSDRVAARAAAEANVPVSTIAFGTDSGTVTYKGETIEVPVDEEALQMIADVTGGTAYQAPTAEQLQAVYEDIGTTVAFETERDERTAAFVGVAMLFAFAAAGTSLLWGQRLP
jgi:Ca-activated chloride channel family protein